MAWRGDEAEAEALDVVIGVIERVDLKLASIAGPGVDLTYRKAPAKTPPRGAAKGRCKFGHRGIVRTRRLFGERPSQQTLNEQLAHFFSLEIVARVGTVERFVAKREIRDNVVLDDSLQQRPLKPGGVTQVASLDPAVPQAQPN